MTNPAAAAVPTFESIMSAGLDALPESGEIPDVPALPVVSDTPVGDGAEEHGETDGGDTAGAGAEGTAGGEGGAGEGGDGAADGTGGTDDSPEAVSARAAAAAGRERNPDGTFKPTAAEAAAAAAKPDAAAAAKPPVKAPDVINDPIPTNLKPATAERMTKLVETAKTLTAERDVAVRDLDTLVQSVERTGMNGQEFGEFLTVVGLARSDKVEDQEQAFGYLTKVVTQLATVLGKTVPGVDPLEGHDDLARRVAAGTLSQADADELANARRQAAATAARQTVAQQRQQQQTTEQTAYETAKTAGRAQMVELETTLAAADPQFGAKKALLMGDAAFMATLKAAHPSQWVTVFNKKYRETKIAAAAAPAARKVVSANAPQPLRGKAPAGGQQVTGAKSLEEAMGNVDFSKA